MDPCRGCPPGIPGRWAPQGDTAVFTPVTGFGPGTRVTVTVPAGSAGVRGRGGAVLSAARGSYSYTTGSYSTLRLQQILAGDPERARRAIRIASLAVWQPAVLGRMR